MPGLWSWPEHHRLLEHLVLGHLGLKELWVGHLRDGSLALHLDLRVSTKLAERLLRRELRITAEERLRTQDGLLELVARDVEGYLSLGELRWLVAGGSLLKLLGNRLESWLLLCGQEVSDLLQGLVEFGNLGGLLLDLGGLGLLKTLHDALALLT